MDKVKAKILEKKLAGKSIQQWTIRSLISHGKSAAVFLADSADGEAAVKIFDTELIARYGDETQFARIERERELIGKSHPNLVKILGGGFDTITENHFIVMEFLKGANLKECLQQIPAEEIPNLISQLASAAHFLEELGYVHRDIKPENIVILDNYKRAVLLDLGVLRPFSGSDITDNEGIQAFVGTLQYSSPEFLLRQEEQTVEGYRALTFYQLGGVLHDLIMRRQLFAESAEPYARLVNAVQHETPEIQNTAVPYYLVDLARCCLLKAWETRLKVLNWNSFDPPKLDAFKGHSIKQRVTNRAVIVRAQTHPDQTKQHEFETLKREALTFLMASARTIRSENSTLPPIKVLQNTPNEMAFGIQFGKAADSALFQDLTILFNLDILDSAAQVIEIQACGCLGQFDRAHPTSAWQVIFQGTYDGQATYAALEACIYDLIDQAQEMSQAGILESSLLPRRSV
jgi:eukaryotic-like serine/threonine-protein kinase